MAIHATPNGIASMAEWRVRLAMGLKDEQDLPMSPYVSLYLRARAPRCRERRADELTLTLSS